MKTTDSRDALAWKIQGFLSDLAPDEDGDITGTGPASYKIADFVISLFERKKSCARKKKIMTDTRKLAIRRRLADCAAHVYEHGTINRSDVMRIGEVSRPQASADIRMLITDYPFLGLTYDKSAKTYVAVSRKV